MKIHFLNIDEVMIPDHKETNEENVQRAANSLKAHGQLIMIQVVNIDGIFYLKSGAYLLKAIKSLGWQKVVAYEWSE